MENGFGDVLKKSFLEGFNSTAPDFGQIITVMIIALLISVYIFFVYRFVTRKEFYSKSFNISLSMLTVITAAIILSVQSSVVISLGMVGALSIVRFRTAVKDPLDLVFLFWSIGVGIICGAGLAAMAAVTSLIITVGMLLLEFIPVGKASMLLIVKGEDCDIEDRIIPVVKKYCGSYKVKSRNIAMGRTDLIFEVRAESRAELIKEVSRLKGIVAASLINHDGEATF